MATRWFVQRRRCLLALLLLPLAFCPSLNGAQQGTAVHIIIIKHTRTLIVLRGDKVLGTYKISLGSNPVGPKEREGDHKTPEGRYMIDAKNAHSRFYRALHISYPNAADRARARRLGVNPGGDIEIHGLGAKYSWIGGAQRLYDWTDGCIAVTNHEIDQIFATVQVGARVEIRP